MSIFKKLAYFFFGIWKNNIINGLGYLKNNRPTKNKLEADINAGMKAKVAGKKDWEILQATFNRMK